MSCIGQTLLSWIISIPLAALIIFIYEKLKSKKSPNYSRKDPRD